MSESSNSGQGSVELLPPPLGSVTHKTTSGSAARAAIGLTSGKSAWVTFVAGTEDCWIAFKKGTAAATVTSSTGWTLTAGVPQHFWINENTYNDVEYIATSSGTLKWYVSSRQMDGQ